MKAMAATAIQNQLYACSNCESLHGPPVLSRHTAAASASEFSNVAFVTLRRGRSSASSASSAASARNSTGNVAKSSSIEPSLPQRSLSNGSTSSSNFTSISRKSRRGAARFAKVGQFSCGSWGMDFALGLWTLSFFFCFFIFFITL
jgi:hypothetical protein